MIISELLKNLGELAPLCYAEDWDNVGLLVGSPNEEVAKVITSIELSPSLIEHAIVQKANVIITHHPIFFKAAKKLIFDERKDDAYLVQKLIHNSIAHICLHTNFDRAPNALHHFLMQKLELKNLQPIEKLANAAKRKEHQDMELGYGLIGELPQASALEEMIPRLKKVFEINDLRVVGDLKKSISRIGFVSGTGMFLYEKARRSGVDLYISGDVKYHEAVRAMDDDVAVADVGHFGAEKHFATVLEAWMKPMNLNVSTYLGTEPFIYV